MLWSFLKTLNASQLSKLLEKGVECEAPRSYLSKEGQERKVLSVWNWIKIEWSLLPVENTMGTLTTLSWGCLFAKHVVVTLIGTTFVSFVERDGTHQSNIAKCFVDRHSGERARRGLLTGLKSLLYWGIKGRRKKSCRRAGRVRRWR